MLRIPVLAGICLLTFLNPAALSAQASNPPPLVTRDAGGSEARGPGAAPAPPEQHRFDRSLVGSARLGIAPEPVPDAAPVRDPLAPVMPASLRHRGPGVALMIVGAAAIVTGLLIDESLITILGAGTGLVGLYLYLR
jgi:hypothetical protein